MNTFLSRSIRRTAAAAFLVSFVSISGPASARPTDPPWLVPPAVGVAGPLTCGRVWGPASYGPGSSMKAVHAAVRDLGACPREKTAARVTSYFGPRNTIPVRQ